MLKLSEALGTTEWNHLYQRSAWGRCIGPLLRHWCKHHRSTTKSKFRNKVELSALSQYSTVTGCVRCGVDYAALGRLPGLRTCGSESEQVINNEASQGKNIRHTPM